ncbi:MAG TPA: hypothetical protein VEZ71_14055 [Archangium sp.]|nr:hypothetical protein [Archangium sp.]
MSRLQKFAKLAVVASAGLIPGVALASPEAPNEVVCRIPVGAAGISYADEGVAEQKAWGPAALAVAPDGSFWVADTAARRLLHYSSTCAQLEVIQLRNVSGITDLAVTGSSIYAFDASAAVPTVLHLSLSGAEYARHPVDADITGIALSENGEVLVERQFGASYQQLLDRDGRVSTASLPGLMVGGTVYNARPADMTRAEAHTGTLSIGGQTVEVSVPNDLGGLRVLGVTRDGNAVVKLEEVALVNDFRVDQTVRVYGQDGTMLGQARVPLAERYTYVQNGLSLNAEGEVFSLVTYRDRSEIQKLGFERELPAVLPVVTMSREDAPPPTAQCRNATDMANVGNWIADFLRGYNSTNIDGYCAGRTKPRFLLSAGTAYRGEAYDWGGWDNPTNYDNLLNQGYQAGDINTAGVESCSRGLDCSGLVSLAWATSTKYSTSTLPNISWQLSSRNSMAKGDIMNCAGSHVVMFDYYTSNGIFMWEATTSNSYDRAVHINREWAYFGSCYVPRRYNSKC